MIQNDTMYLEQNTCLIVAPNKPAGVPAGDWTEENAGQGTAVTAHDDETRDCCWNKSGTPSHLLKTDDAPAVNTAVCDAQLCTFWHPTGAVTAAPSLSMTTAVRQSSKYLVFARPANQNAEWAASFVHSAVPRSGNGKIFSPLDGPSSSTFTGDDGVTVEPELGVSMSWTQLEYSADVEVLIVPRDKNVSWIDRDVVIRPLDSSCELLAAPGGAIVRVPHSEHGQRISIEIEQDLHTYCSNGTSYTADGDVVGTEPVHALLLFASPFLPRKLVPNASDGDVKVMTPGAITAADLRTDKEVLLFGPGVYWSANASGALGQSHLQLSASTSHVHLAGGAFVRGAVEWSSAAEELIVSGHGVLSGEHYVYQANPKAPVPYSALKSDASSLRMWSGHASVGQTWTCIGPTIASPPFNTMDFRGDVRHFSSEIADYKQVGAFFFQTDGPELYPGSDARGLFLHTNDDSIKTYYANVAVSNVTVWKARNGPVIQTGWTSRSVSNVSVQGLRVIHSRYVSSDGPTAAIIGASPFYEPGKVVQPLEYVSMAVSDVVCEGLCPALLRLHPLQSYDLSISHVFFPSGLNSALSIGESEIPAVTSKGRAVRMNLTIAGWSVGSEPVTMNNFQSNKLGQLNIDVSYWHQWRVLKSDDTSDIHTNLPIFRWKSLIPRDANSSVLLLQVYAGSTKDVYDSGPVQKFNPHNDNASSWPVEATTYGGPPLAPHAVYRWRYREATSTQDYGWNQGGLFRTAVSLPTAQAEAAAAASSPVVERLMDGQYANLLARISKAGYLSTSVYGGYSGLYTRDTSAAVIALVQMSEGSGGKSALAAAGKVLRFMLKTFSSKGLKDHTSDVIELDRAPHCTWIWSEHDCLPPDCRRQHSTAPKPPPAGSADFCPSFANASCSESAGNCTCFATGNATDEPFHDQVDGTAHLILAYARYVSAAKDDALAKEYFPLMKRFLSTYVGVSSGTLSAYVNLTLGLIWNPGFEGPGASNYNLLTNLFIVEALRVMAPRAQAAGEAETAAHWKDLRLKLLAGTEANLTTSVGTCCDQSLGGCSLTTCCTRVYAQYRDHSDNAALNTELTWVNYSPVAAAFLAMAGDVSPQEVGLNLTLMANTLAAVRANGSFEWGASRGDAQTTSTLPLTMALTSPYDFAVIVKGLGWELAFATFSYHKPQLGSVPDYQRLTAIYRWLGAVAGEVPVRVDCKGSPCTANSSQMLGESYFYQPYLKQQWYFGDIGNAEQTAWFLFGNAIARRTLGLKSDNAV